MSGLGRPPPPLPPAASKRARWDNEAPSGTDDADEEDEEEQAPFALWDSKRRRWVDDEEPASEYDRGPQRWQRSLRSATAPSRQRQQALRPAAAGAAAGPAGRDADLQQQRQQQQQQQQQRRQQAEAAAAAGPVAPAGLPVSTSRQQQQARRPTAADAAAGPAAQAASRRQRQRARYQPTAAGAAATGPAGRAASRQRQQQQSAAVDLADIQQLARANQAAREAAYEAGGSQFKPYAVKLPPRPVEAPAAGAAAAAAAVGYADIEAGMGSADEADGRMLGEAEEEWEEWSEEWEGDPLEYKSFWASRLRSICGRSFDDLLQQKQQDNRHLDYDEDVLVSELAEHCRSIQFNNPEIETTSLIKWTVAIVARGWDHQEGRYKWPPPEAALDVEVPHNRRQAAGTLVQGQQQPHPAAFLSARQAAAGGGPEPPPEAPAEGQAAEDRSADDVVRDSYRQFTGLSSMLSKLLSEHGTPSAAAAVARAAACRAAAAAAMEAGDEPAALEHALDAAVHAAVAAGTVLRGNEEQEEPGQPTGSAQQAADTSGDILSQIHLKGTAYCSSLRDGMASHPAPLGVSVMQTVVRANEHVGAATTAAQSGSQLDAANRSLAAAVHMTFAAVTCLERLAAQPPAQLAVAGRQQVAQQPQLPAAQPLAQLAVAGRQQQQQQRRNYGMRGVAERGNGWDLTVDLLPVYDRLLYISGFQQAALAAVAHDHARVWRALHQAGCGALTPPAQLLAAVEKVPASELNFPVHEYTAGGATLLVELADSSPQQLHQRLQPHRLKLYYVQQEQAALAAAQQAAAGRQQVPPPQQQAAPAVAQQGAAGRPAPAAAQAASQQAPSAAGGGSLRFAGAAAGPATAAGVAPAARPAATRRSRQAPAAAAAAPVLDYLPLKQHVSDSQFRAVVKRRFNYIKNVVLQRSQRGLECNLTALHNAVVDQGGYVEVLAARDECERFYQAAVAMREAGKLEGGPAEFSTMARRLHAVYQTYVKPLLDPAILTAAGIELSRRRKW
ncbi:hypothetical protein COHA_003725 [Chlorella ohadii]|uniref:Uncharacterized protein n=1 Tax=Chlorella ohadii TaxID=2649997 RepID=A0AAD5DT06_9CHLO|nr:hypothetical protein COHA_003725 [Chlorella ohadii]